MRIITQTDTGRFSLTSRAVRNAANGSEARPTLPASPWRRPERKSDRYLWIIDFLQGYLCGLSVMFATMCFQDWERREEKHRLKYIVVSKLGDTRMQTHTHTHMRCNTTQYLNATIATIFISCVCTIGLNFLLVSIKIKIFAFYYNIKDNYSFVWSVISDRWSVQQHLTKQNLCIRMQANQINITRMPRLSLVYQVKIFPSQKPQKWPVCSSINSGQTGTLTEFYNLVVPNWCKKKQKTWQPSCFESQGIHPALTHKLSCLFESCVLLHTKSLGTARSAKCSL